MTFLSHALVGASIGVALSNTTGVDTSLTVPLNIGLSLLPDINLLWRKISDHHNDFTHYPLLWVILATIVWYLEPSPHIYSLSILLSGLFHLILDTFGMTIGVHWLAPFNSKEFSFTKIHAQPEQKSMMSKISQFHKTRHLYYEMIIILSCTLVIWIF
ncbi:MAG TPA: metal-dependent hydrolase [Candidatus Woesebacteria bacterium]|nr:metal-dependent hydrolase [Candidatus Woesebacteria bacterium]